MLTKLLNGVWWRAGALTPLALALLLSCKTTNRSSAKVIGVPAVTPGSYKQVVGIGAVTRSGTKKFIGTGSFCAPNFVITDAHVVADPDFDRYVITKGDDRWFGSSFDVPAKNASYPKEYLPSYDGSEPTSYPYDIGFIEITDPANFATAEEILPLLSIGVDVGTPGTVVGFGNDENPSGDKPGIKRAGNLVVDAIGTAHFPLDTSIGNATANGNVLSMRAADGASDGKEGQPSNGDSGGPFIVTDPQTGKPAIAGLVQTRIRTATGFLWLFANLHNSLTGDFVAQHVPFTPSGYDDQGKALHPAGATDGGTRRTPVSRPKDDPNAARSGDGGQGSAKPAPAAPREGEHPR